MRPPLRGPLELPLPKSTPNAEAQRSAENAEKDQIREIFSESKGIEVDISRALVLFFSAVSALLCALSVGFVLTHQSRCLSTWIVTVASSFLELGSTA